MEFGDVAGHAGPSVEIGQHAFDMHEVHAGAERLALRADADDAGVVGLPDERFGETITALVELVAGAEAPGVDELKAWVRSQLADYKAPRRVLVVDSVGRSPNGKLDYGMLKTRAAEGLTGG